MTAPSHGSPFVASFPEGRWVAEDVVGWQGLRALRASGQSFSYTSPEEHEAAVAAVTVDEALDFLRRLVDSRTWCSSTSGKVARMVIRFMRVAMGLSTSTRRELPSPKVFRLLAVGQPAEGAVTALLQSLSDADLQQVVRGGGR